MTAAAEGGEVRALDRLFPNAEGRTEDSAQQDAWRAEIALIGLGVLVAAVFFVTGGRYEPIPPSDSCMASRPQ